MQTSISIRGAAMGLVALALAAIAPDAVAGQGAGAGSRPLFLAIPEVFPEGIDARAVLMREPGRDIVILDAADADPETLRVSLLLLSRVEREHPTLAEDRAQLIPITGFVAGTEIPAEERERLEVALGDLRARPRANVGNLGWGQWMRYRN